MSVTVHAGAKGRDGVEDHSAAGIPAAGQDDVLVIGVGNDLRADDGAGHAVVEELTRLAVPGLRAVWSHQLVPELAEQFTGTGLVVFVDAAVTGSQPHDRSGAPQGVQVHRVTAASPGFGGHRADPAALLGLAALAGLPVPEAYLISIPAHDLGLGTQLSAPTRAAVADAVTEVLRLASPDSPDRQRTGPGRDGA